MSFICRAYIPRVIGVAVPTPQTTPQTKTQRETVRDVKTHSYTLLAVIQCTEMLRSY